MSSLKRGHEGDTDLEQNGAQAIKHVKNVPDAPSSSNSSFIILDVGGRKFRTIKATLIHYTYFNSLIDERFNNQQEDGSYFIDADPDVFEHVLDFMRRGTTFPLFWSKEKGFDFALYNKLSCEADYFGLHDLRDWIRKKKFQRGIYASGIKVITTPIYDCHESFFIDDDSVSDGTSLNYLKAEIVNTPETQKWVCPGYESHDDPSVCYDLMSEACLNHDSGDLAGHWEKSTKVHVLTIRETQVDMNAFINGAE
ncbi:hypothetical protein K505DRAFT_325268 [Melanomma pulvis-pyrius CBS 109.77]|uniref:BTB domain-containing protein n=1 Tax=Melanomma pulvis-pyrius CBS 109.77 TaxID=1314802 RepID=A0A6A6XC55_9PLEO|nr:hypothetical protein K505DRAFT_325268 [Melanomma pulvis-pyrius CBS 109.77]